VCVCVCVHVIVLYACLRVGPFRGALDNHVLGFVQLRVLNE
jgi:hypothetical protein